MSPAPLQSLESITQVKRLTVTEEPDCCKQASTRVVLPWSTWAMIAIIANRARSWGALRGRVKLITYLSCLPGRFNSLRVRLSLKRPVPRSRRTPWSLPCGEGEFEVITVGVRSSQRKAGVRSKTSFRVVSGRLPSPRSTAKPCCVFFSENPGGASPWPRSEALDCL